MNDGLQPGILGGLDHMRAVYANIKAKLPKDAQPTYFVCIVDQADAEQCDICQ